MKPTLHLLTALLLSAASMHAAEIPSAKPNIIVILTDDQGYGDLSCHGNPILKTPNIDRLHDEGVRLTEFHVSPTCSPTRSALMSGRHEFRNGVTHTVLRPHHPQRAARTAAGPPRRRTALRRQGETQ